MLKRLFKAIAIAMLVAAISPFPVNAQSGTQAKLGGEARGMVAKKLAAALREQYIFPDIGERAAGKISTALAAGEYDELTDPAAFAARLEADVGAIAHDKHLRVRAMSAGLLAPPPAANLMPRSEAGVVRADRLAGGIGYIEVVAFPPMEWFKPVLDKAMLALKGSKALIIDVRRNGGGWPASVAYLASYFIAPGKPVHINDIVKRTAGTDSFTRESFYSSSTPIHFAGRPIYVLTSKWTFSGGEGFAYEMQAMKRGILVGEVTGGGANPTGPVQLGQGFIASIPFGRAENPVTKTNWEGRGVQPDVSVAASDAFRLVLERLGQKPVVDVVAASQKQLFTARSTPASGSEAALRKLLAGLASGTPDYTAMTPQFANLNRQQLSGLQGMVAPLGEVRSVTFREVDTMGGDSYDVVFSNGALLVSVALAPDGKLAAGSIAPRGAPKP